MTTNNITQKTLEEIKTKNRIDEVISEYIHIQRKGKNYISICPFHSDKNPSMHISPEKKIFKCFSCNAGGDVIEFVKRYKNIHFTEAVSILAKRAKINLEINVISNKRKYNESEEKIFEINKIALSFFKFSLINNANANKYLINRGINNNQIEKFDLGFSDIKNSLTKFLIKKGYEDSLLIKIGLSKLSSKDEVIDFFINRIIFPIKDIDDNILGFSGRTLSNEFKPKYLNTIETEVFKKNKIFYNLNHCFSASASSSSIVIVEGYMDVISLSRAGVNNTLAIMGTSLTKENTIFLKKNTKKIILLFDNDEAGFRASINGFKILYENNLENISYILLPKNIKDIDELTKTKDSALKILKSDLTVEEFIFEFFKNKFDLKRTNILKTLFSLISKVLSIKSNDLNLELNKENIVNMISTELKITKETVLSSIIISKKKTYPPPQQEYLVKQKSIYNSDTEKQTIKNLSIRESILLKAACESRENYLLIWNKYNPHNIGWWLKINKIIFLQIQSLYENDSKKNEINLNELLLNLETKKEKKYLSELISENELQKYENSYFSKRFLEEEFKYLNSRADLKEKNIKNKMEKEKFDKKFDFNL